MESSPCLLVLSSLSSQQPCLLVHCPQVLLSAALSPSSPPSHHHLPAVDPRRSPLPALRQADHHTHVLGGYYSMDPSVAVASAA